MEPVTTLPTESHTEFDAQPSVRGSWRTYGQPVSVALVSGGLVLILRETGILVGAAAVAVAVICFVLAPGTRQFSDRFMLAAALCIGWLPLIGWLPRIESRIDLPGVLLAIAVGIVAARQLRQGRRGPRTVQLPSAAEWIALGLGALTSLWWARPFRGMTTSGILGTLQNIGYDNVTHFGMFRSNLRLGSFVQAQPTLPGRVSRLGYDYPQGIHQAWAQLTRLVQPHVSLASASLLHTYLTVLLVTAGGAVALGCMAVCRLCKEDVLVAIPAMAVVLALFAVGTFTPFDGFANFELAIVAVATAVTLMVRPTLAPGWNFFAVAGMGLVAAYNWYPVVALMAPALVVASLRAWRSSHGRARVAMTVVICGTALAYLRPVTTFSHRGLSWLNQPTSSLATPWGLLILVVAALITLACVRQVSDPDLWTNVVIGGAAVMGGGAVVFFAAYEVHSTGSVPYYGQKLASAVLAICAVVLVAVAAHHLVRSRARKRLPTLLAVALSGLLAFAALQFDGYVGPSVLSPFPSNNAGGIALRKLVFQQPRRSIDAARVLLAAQRTGGRPGRWFYLEPNPPSGIRSILLAQWFLVLHGDPANEDSFAPTLDGTYSASQLAHAVRATYPHPEENGFHLFVPAWLRRAIAEQDAAWGRPGRLFVIPTPTSI